MKRAINAILGKCPKCESGYVFKTSGNPVLFKMPVMHKKCTKCSYAFEREPGFFFGAMYVSYSLAVAELVAILVIAKFILGAGNITLVVLVALAAILMSTFNFRVSRTVWMYLFEKKNAQS